MANQGCQYAWKPNYSCTSSSWNVCEWIPVLHNAIWKTTEDELFQYQECRQTLRKDSSSRRPVRRPYAYDLSQEDLLHPVKRMKTISNAVCMMFISHSHEFQGHHQSQHPCASFHSLLFFTKKIIGRVNSNELSTLVQTDNLLKSRNCEYCFWLQDSRLLKDHLQPQQNSFKRKKSPTDACTTEARAKKPRHEGAVQSASREDASTTQNAGLTWSLQGTQILRYVASRVRQTIQKHLFKRSSAIPVFRWH